MAIPLSAESAQTAPQFERQRARTAPYGWADAFLYVFRGRGLFVFGSYLVALALLAILGLIPILGVAAGCFSMIFVVMVLFIVPGALTKIVRETAVGENELSDWPEFLQFGERLGEVLGFLITGLISTIPLLVALELGGCADSGDFASLCWLILVVGWFLAMAIWVPAFGAVSVLHDNFVAFRFDRHARVLTGFGGRFWPTVLLSTALIVVGQVVSFFAMAVPLFGLVASAAIGMYSWFTAAHLIGLFFRRNTAELADIYGPW